MAFKTKQEKQAFRSGLLAGLKKAKRNRRKKPYNRQKAKRGQARKRASDNPFGMTYMQLIREYEQRKRDLFGDFDYDSRGRIKGSYTIDGKFEPD